VGVIEAAQLAPTRRGLVESAAALRRAQQRCVIAFGRAAAAHDRFAEMLERVAAQRGDEDGYRRAAEQRVAAAADRARASELRRSLN